MGEVWAEPSKSAGIKRAAGLPFLPPASTTMLQMVMRSSMVIASMASPQNSMAL